MGRQGKELNVFFHVARICTLWMQIMQIKPLSMLSYFLIISKKKKICWIFFLSHWRYLIIITFHSEKTKISLHFCHYFFNQPPFSRKNGICSACGLLVTCSDSVFSCRLFLIENHPASSLVDLDLRLKISFHGVIC